jgi:predicted nucleic acid-binding protein
MIVVDTNIISYFYLEGEYTKLAEKVFKKDPDWVVPLLWRSEFRNVLALYIRNKILTLEDAIKIIGKAELLLNGKEYTVNSANILELVNQSECTSYDCEFVALANDLGVSLVTMDKKVLTHFPSTAVRLDQFVG